MSSNKWQMGAKWEFNVHVGVWLTSDPSLKMAILCSSWQCWQRSQAVLKAESHTAHSRLRTGSAEVQTYRHSYIYLHITALKLVKQLIGVFNHIFLDDKTRSFLMNLPQPGLRLTQTTYHGYDKSSVLTAAPC